MPRTLQNGYAPSSQQDTITTVTRGGTGAATPDQAVINLGGINTDLLNTPNGIARLDPSGLLYTEILPSQITTGSTVNGPTSLTINQVQAYTITNYSSFKTYDVQAISGSVSVSGATITYTAPATEGVGGFTINGRLVNITVIGIKPVAPTITAPIFNATGVSTTGTITTSAFAMTTGSDTHASSDWQVATDSAFTNVLSQSLNDTVNKTSWAISPAIPNNATFYVRVRHKGTTYGYGAWSATTIFTTGSVSNVTTEESVLVSPNGDNVNSGLFGMSVSIDGTGSKVAISQTGTLGVFIFARSGSDWILEQKIVAGDISDSDKFGYSISLGDLGTRIAIGCPQNDTSGTNTGAVYIYRKDSNWVLEQKLQASVPSPGDYFGYSVCLSGSSNKLVVGAPYKDNGGSDRGSVYVFARSSTTWTQEAILTASDAANNDYFGSSVAITNDSTRIIVGTLSNDASGLADSGAAYVFKFNVTWTQEIKLTASDGAVGDNFGFAVAISGDGARAAVSAYYSQPGSLYRAGAVYIFSKNVSDVWSQESKLVASDKAINDQFGYSVSMSDNGAQVVVGANNKVYSGTTRGKIYLFSRSVTVWSETIGFQGDTSPDVRNLGSSIAIAKDRSRVISGAVGSYISSVYSGSASIYR